MSTSKHYDLIAIIAMAVAVIIAVAVYGVASANGSALTNSSSSKKYETTLFDTTKVHTINLEVDDWDGFIANCENEEYISCNATIDGTTVQVVGLRAKGNTSLSSVSSMGSQRYSFKLEFDHYRDGGNYDGLDKLSLNNCIQDTTYMKDYISYQLMREMGVDAPLCSYAYITVNGNDWGLYLAVEGVEESYLERTKDGKGELYKPDNLSMGAGAGNGKNFNMDDFNAKREEASGDASNQGQSQGQGQSSPDNSSQMPGGQMPDADSMPSMPGGQMPSGNFDTSQMPEGAQDFAGQTPPDGTFDFSSNSNMFGGGMGGMGSGNGTDLKYIDDNRSSYGAIFDNSVTDTTVADQNRVVKALKTLSEGTNVNSAINVDQVVRYFAAHNFVVNSDSYTGTMVHNYYLYENDGKLSMIPWDYNLAFGTFTASDASSAVNDAIDTPLQANGDGSLPMFDFIVNDQEYLQLYHQYLQQLCSNVDLQGMIDQTSTLIAPYVAKDATAFYSYEEFEKGVSALKSFCNLRVQSIQAQLNGTIASTDAARSNSDQLIDASSLTLSDMGSMGGGMGGKDDKGGMDSTGGRPTGSSDSNNTGNQSGTQPEGTGGESTPGNSGNGFDFSNMPEGATPPSGGDSSDNAGSGSFPGGSQGATPPGGFNGGGPSGGGSAPTGGFPSGTPS